MAIKQDRPADFAGDGVVVYMAKSVEDVNKARAGLFEAGIHVELPEAAVEALFASGKKSLPIRVSTPQFRDAQKAIDKIFPPPVIDLPPLDDEKPAAAAPAGKGAAALAGDEDSGDPGRKGPEMDGYRPDLSRPGGTSVAKIEQSATKVLFIGLASFILPVAGIFTGGFAIHSAWWCMERLNPGSARTRAQVAMGLGIGAIVFQLIASVVIAWQVGAFD